MTDLLTRQGDPLSQPTPKLAVVEAAIAPWRVFRQRPWRFAALALIPAVAILMLPFLSLPFSGANKVADIVVAAAIAIIQYAVQVASQNASIYGGERVINEMSFSVGDAFGVGFRRLPAVVGMGLLAILIIFAGLILLVIPGLIAAVALALAAPACVIEGLGPIAAIKRSFALSKGNKWRIVGTALIGLILPFFVLAIVSSLLAAALVAVHLWFLSLLPLLLMFLIFAAVGPLLLSVLFVELRSLKEGVGPRAAVARVFD